VNQADWKKLQQKLAAVEEEFMKVIDSFNAKVHDQKITEVSWSVKDVLSHIVGWEVEVVKKFKTFLINPEVDDNYDINLFNKIAVKSRKHLTWGQIVLELKTAQTELAGFLSNLTQKEIDGEKRFIEWVEVLVNHYVHHIEQLKPLT